MCNSTIKTRDGKEFACGKCEQCHNRYVQHWTFRLQQEMYKTPRCVFLTLTYDYANIPMNKGKFTLCKKDYQDFIKRLRKKFTYRKIKYVCTGEYGTNKSRPHYHLILFDIDKLDFNDIQSIWGKGTIHVGSVEPASIAYMFKYSTKKSQKQPDWRQIPQFVSMSKGLGEDFAFYITYQSNTYVNKNGVQIVRKYKVRTPKPHFKSKLDTLVQMPYYQLPSTKGGIVKMSVPRFYLDAANYDKTELTEIFKDKMQEKYDCYPEPLKNVVILRETIQRKEAPYVWEKRVKHAISKENI